MLDTNKTLPSARTLAENNSVRINGESAAYRKARTALLAEEIELRRHIERVAAMRRTLPPGATVKNYSFIGESGAEMDGSTADPGQDPRGAPDLMPLWTVLDCTPEGRRPDWYPKLDYGR